MCPVLWVHFNNKKQKKKGNKLSLRDFYALVRDLETSDNPDDLLEADIIKSYRLGGLTNEDSSKRTKILLNAYSKGETVYDVLAKNGYMVKIKKNGGWKLKKIKKEKPMLDSEGVSKLEDIEVAIIHKIEEIFVDIAQKCKSDDEIETVLTEMADNNRLCVSIDLTDFLLDLIELLKRLRKDLSSENETTEVKEL